MKINNFHKPTLWKFFLACFVMFQLALTFAGKNIWPFSSHTFFAFNVPHSFETDSLSYYDAKGREIKADASSFMPVEFFKAHRIAEYVMTSPTISEKDKKDFFKTIFERAKVSPWKRFDETYPSIIIPSEFIPVRVEISVDTKTYDFSKYGIHPLVVKATPLASLNFN
ncbi:hypothetical protein K3H46_13295 [Aeromonas veronii]|uniref:hypothetical protein n=1 Tax=Aeromonas veronii TaxID=654 RepID=UPI001F1F2101|nr:hypothetical protein [Aeromonas veronii]MCF5891995.1 hypothetical protein [Aeromonas veronii]